MSWVADTAWAILASTWTSLNFLGMNAFVPFYCIIITSVLFSCAHVLGVCSPFPAVELIVRSYLFVCMCAIMFFGKRCVVNLERNVYTRSIPFICAHVLLVSLYILVPSFMVCSFAFFFVSYRTRASECALPTHRGPQPASQPAAQPAAQPYSPAAHDPEEQRLVMQLRAAMAAQG